MTRRKPQTGSPGRRQRTAAAPWPRDWRHRAHHRSAAVCPRLGGWRAEAGRAGARAVLQACRREHSCATTNACHTEAPATLGLNTYKQRPRARRRGLWPSGRCATRLRLAARRGRANRSWAHRSPGSFGVLRHGCRLRSITCSPTSAARLSHERHKGRRGARMSEAGRVIPLGGGQPPLERHAPRAAEEAGARSNPPSNVRCACGNLPPRVCVCA